jgi:hypothetical protein
VDAQLTVPMAGLEPATQPDHLIRSAVDAKLIFESSS